MPLFFLAPISTSMPFWRRSFISWFYIDHNQEAKPDSSLQLSFLLSKLRKTRVLVQFVDLSVSSLFLVVLPSLAHLELVLRITALQVTQTL